MPRAVVAAPRTARIPIPSPARRPPKSRDVDNRIRSAQWVDELARQFQDNYKLERRHRVFWKGYEGNKEHFGVNELLFDIAVCSVSTTPSLQRHPQPLEFITGCHWQVESEFADNSTRPVIVDMSKLVLGSAENKLMVAARRDGKEARQSILAQCADIAACCRTNVYFLFVSHPREWESAPCSPLLYEWTAGDWRPIDSQSD